MGGHRKRTTRHGAERPLAGIVRLAIRDARQEKDVRLRTEASRWLWEHAPGIAERAGVPARQSNLLGILE